MRNEGLNCCCESTAGLTDGIEESSCPVCETLGSRVKRVTLPRFDRHPEWLVK